MCLHKRQCVIKKISSTISCTHTHASIHTHTHSLSLSLSFSLWTVTTFYNFIGVFANACIIQISASPPKSSSSGSPANPPFFSYIFCCPPSGCAVFYFLYTWLAPSPSKKRKKSHTVDKKLSPPRHGWDFKRTRSEWVRFDENTYYRMCSLNVWPYSLLTRVSHYDARIHLEFDRALQPLYTHVHIHIHAHTRSSKMKLAAPNGARASPRFPLWK